MRIALAGEVDEITVTAMHRRCGNLRIRCFLLLLLGLGFFGATEAADTNSWRGVHLWLDNDASARALAVTLPELAKLGVNTVVVEVNYSYEFKAHPELRNKTFIHRATARALADEAARHHIRLIPEFNCLGHQNFGRRIEPLLKVHPEFNETPSLSLTNPSVYCLSWCPRTPGLDAIVNSLIDEIADGFQAKSFHVGLDEVYLIGSDECPRCRGGSPAKLFAEQVRALHQHIVGEQKLEMLMWADRVIGAKFQGQSKYDNERNDLSACIDLIPRDIIQCDWHYEGRTNYPSVPYLAGKGFRVWPAGFQPVGAARALSDFAKGQQDERVIGYLATTWNETKITNAPSWPPIKEILPGWRKR